MLMERIMSRENLLSALKRVERNKGSHGVDEMPIQKPTEAHYRTLGIHENGTPPGNL